MLVSVVKFLKEGNDSLINYGVRENAKDFDIIDEKIVHNGVDPRMPRTKGQTWKDLIEGWPRPIRYTLAPLYEFKGLFV